jgi:hypothetical protein
MSQALAGSMVAKKILTGMKEEGSNKEGGDERR